MSARSDELLALVLAEPAAAITPRTIAALAVVHRGDTMATMGFAAPLTW